MIRRLIVYVLLLFILFNSSCTSEKIYMYADDKNNLYEQLLKEGYKVVIYDDLNALISEAPENASIMILAKDYPLEPIRLSREDIIKIEEKKLRCYVEYVSTIDNEILTDDPVQLSLERVVVKGIPDCDYLPEMSLLSMNNSFILPVKKEESLLVTAKVVGFDKAEFGLEGTSYNSLLFFYSDDILISTSKLSDFATARFTPEYKWEIVFEYIMTWLTKADSKIKFKNWLSYVKPSFSEDYVVSDEDKKNSIKKGLEWFYNGKFLLDEGSYPIYKKYESDWPYGPGLDSSFLNGDGSLGVLEGHASIVHANGKQDYRYWLRNDVQGEVALALYLGGKYLDNAIYSNNSENILKFAFENYRTGVRSDKNSSNYGLMSWTNLHPNVYYGDDNARALLGYILANKDLKNEEINKKIVECIIGNFRTSSVQGYKGSHGVDANVIEKNGWRSYFDMDFINPHPHFESWIWACYLWLYNKTGYTPLLEKAKTGIATTMSAYPYKWRWTNGIQQERGRMILPLAWLVRVDPTDLHKKWLNQMIDDLLKYQVVCGAIQEQMGDPSLNFVGNVTRNEDYGKYEAPLIFRNGDPVSDMLYTTNFFIFGLNEAVELTGNPKHEKALSEIRDFLIKIQVSSSKYKDLDGAWFRAFNYENWDYWADNADNGWGAWCTLTGWIQSWIVSTQILMDMNTTYWDITDDISLNFDYDSLLKEMLYEKY